MIAVDIGAMRFNDYVAAICGRDSRHDVYTSTQGGASLTFR